MSCLCLIHVQIKDLLCSEDVQTQLAGSLFVGLTTAFHMRKVERNEKSQVSLSPYSCCVNGTHWHDISRLKPSVLPPPHPPTPTPYFGLHSTNSGFCNMSK